MDGCFGRASGTDKAPAATPERVVDLAGRAAALAAGKVD
jgi:hypothetical protein